MNCTFPRCGDGIIHLCREDVDECTDCECEECDDGNLIDGDGCSSQCLYEYICTVEVDHSSAVGQSKSLKTESKVEKQSDCMQLECDNTGKRYRYDVVKWIATYCKCK